MIELILIHLVITLEWLMDNLIEINLFKLLIYKCLSMYREV